MPEPCPPVTEAEFTALPVVLQETWETGRLVNLEFAEGGLRLRSQPGYREDRRFPSADWNGVVAMAIDRCDQIHILDQGGRLWIYDQIQQTGERLPCLLPLDAPSGLAVSDLAVFISKSLSHRVVALSRVNGQIRWTWDEAGADPGDLAFSSDHLFVLDRAGRRVIVLGPAGTVLRQFGEDNLRAPSRMALGGIPLKEGTVSATQCSLEVTGLGTSFTAELAVGDIILVRGHVKRVWEIVSDTSLKVDTPFVAAIPAGTPIAKLVIYVLDRDGDSVKIVRFNPQGTHVPSDIEIPRSISAASLAVDRAGILYVGMKETRQIHRFLPGGSSFEPLFGYIGPAFHIAFDHQGHLLLVTDGGVLVRLNLAVTYPSSGSFLLKPLDLGPEHPDWRWHKLLLEADHPDETRIAVRYLITGAEKTLNELESLSDSAWSAPLVNFTDALVESPTGRFLALRGELFTNNPLATSSIRVLTAVFPRQSYLRYLPPIYQDDPGGQAFLERFLSIFETLTGGLDARIDATPRLIDPAATPTEFLPWLSSWLAFGLEEGWSESQRRLFLAEAMTLYKQRGTREGISRFVEVITGNAPIIVEPFQLGCLQDSDLRTVYEQLYGAGDCHFCLLLEPQLAHKREMMALVRRMVEEQTPAHVRPGVLGLRPWFRLGLHTYLDINTQLTRPAIRLEESVFGGGETGLIDLDLAGQVERKARIGLDANLT